MDVYRREGKLSHRLYHRERGHAGKSGEVRGGGEGGFRPSPGGGVAEGRR